MKELKCPRCGATFAVDEADYALILNQVKNEAFEAELERRIAEYHKQQEAEQTAAVLRSEQGFRKQLSEKDDEIAGKNTEIARLNERLGSIEQAKKLELAAELSKKEQEIGQLRQELSSHESDLRIAVLEEKNKAQALIQEKERAVADLENKLAAEKDAEAI